MRYIKSFPNDGAIQGAVDNGTLGHPYIALDDELHKIDWDNKRNWAEEYFTIEALEDGRITLYKNWIYFSINDGEWTYNQYNPQRIDVVKGDKIRLKNMSDDSLKVGVKGDSNTRFKVYGNIMSLDWGDNFIGKTTLRKRLNEVFSEAKDLLMDVSGLVLPAKAFSDRGTYHTYYMMFVGCTSITKAPVLPATTIPQGGYDYMFYGCTNLNYVKCLATGGYNYASDWLNGVAASGTFVKNKYASWPEGTIPSGWTQINAE